MARPLRLEYEGAVYHLTRRGNERGAIFRDDRDGGRFVQILGLVGAGCRWVIHSYCLMVVPPIVGRLGWSKSRVHKRGPSLVVPERFRRNPPEGPQVFPIAVKAASPGRLPPALFMGRAPWVGVLCRLPRSGPESFPPSQRHTGCTRSTGRWRCHGSRCAGGWNQ
jgi:hypothetical protein